jgi:cytidylate kinase
MALGGTLPLSVEAGPGSSEIQVLIREAIEQTAARGDVVITAHAASHALKSDASILRVLVTASPSTRAERVSGQSGIEIGKAQRAVKTSDASRRDYLKRLYDVAEELPTQYDLVINTDDISVEEASALVVHAATRRQTPATHA